MPWRTHAWSALKRVTLVGETDKGWAGLGLLTNLAVHVAGQSVGVGDLV